MQEEENIVQCWDGRKMDIGMTIDASMTNGQMGGIGSLSVSSEIGLQDHIVILISIVKNKLTFELTTNIL